MADQTTLARHPLDPLNEGEIATACTLVRERRGGAEALWFPLVLPNEPTHAEMRAWRSGNAPDRRVDLVLLDRTNGEIVEARVSVRDERILRWDVLGPADERYGQPPIMIEEAELVERVVKADPRWREAILRRGITDPDLVQVDPFSAGHLGTPDEHGRRIIRAVSYARLDEDDNAFAHPVDSLVAYVDVNAGEVVDILDDGEAEVPWTPGRYGAGAVPQRTDVKPLDIVQADGPSFSVRGHEVSWQNWRLRVGFNAREGLVLHDLGYRDGGRVRPVLHRASICEMVVPYADPRPAYWWRSAFDVGEYGLGKLANSLELGCDCLGHIHYFDAVLADEQGYPFVKRNAICMHEEDYGVLWKHTDPRTGAQEVRRSRRLVISFFATVGNYDYGFYWYFYQDGTIGLEAKLTGIVMSAVAPDDGYRYGAAVSPGVVAPHHQHLFCTRLDVMVDGERNSVYEVDVEPCPTSPENPHGNAFTTRETPLRTEREGARLADPLRNRYWRIVNASRRNALGEPTAYKLIPHAAPVLLAQPEATVARRAGFASKHLWVTRYEPRERYAAGDFPNQHPGDDGLPAWIERDGTIEDEALVLWHAFGTTHIARPEEWPIMPVEYVGFVLKPAGFFDRNPSLDVPSPDPKRAGVCHGGECHE
jgi:primary-amine oxidase